jgi:TonB family protein
MLQENSAHTKNLQQNASSAAVPRATAVPDLGTFARAIVVEAPGYAERRAVHSIFSFLAHVAMILAFFWFWPLAFPRQPYVFAMNPQFLAVPLSAPATFARTNFSFARSGLSNPFLAMKLQAPVPRFDRPAAAAPPLEDLIQPQLQIAGGIGPLFASIVSEAARPQIGPALPLDIPANAQVFRAGGDIRASRLIERVSFDYPEIAKLAHIFGEVVIAAVIDETGKVTNAHWVSGPGVLASSAIEALSKERFQPTLLDGQPIKCDLMVRVKFRLAGWGEDGTPW